MKNARPVGITLLGYFYIFGAVVVLIAVCLGAKQIVPMNLRFGVPDIPELAVSIFVSLFSFVLAYGYLNMTRWGFWIMVVYSVLFLLISFNQASVYKSQPFIGNAVFSGIVLVYTFMKRRYFHITLTRAA